MGIKWHIFKPSKWEEANGFKRSNEQCSFSVHNDYGIGFHQCPRKPKEQIEGYGFCIQHSKIIKKEK